MEIPQAAIFLDNLKIDFKLIIVLMPSLNLHNIEQNML